MRRSSPRGPRPWPGGIIACHQLGYGIVALGVGPLQDAGLSLSAIFGWTAIVAAVLAALALVLNRRAKPR